METCTSWLQPPGGTLYGAQKKGGGGVIRSCDMMSPDGGLSVLLPSGSGGLISLPPPVPSFSLFSLLAAGRLKPLLRSCLITYTHTSVRRLTNTHRMYVNAWCVCRRGGEGGGARSDRALTVQRWGEKMEAIKYRQFSVSVFFLLGNKTRGGE